MRKVLGLLLLGITVCVGDENPALRSVDAEKLVPMKSKSPHSPIPTWRGILEKRPVLSLFYYPGHPSPHATHMPIDDTLDRILEAFDPILTDDASRLPRLPEPGGSLETIRKELSRLFQPLKNKSYDKLIHTHMAITCSDAKGQSLPPWYKKNDDVWEMDSNKNKMGPSLLNPALYDKVFGRYILDCVGAVPERKQIQGWYLESEPRVYIRPHTINKMTQDAFKTFMKEQVDDIKKFNEVAGTRYASFDDIKMNDKNWLLSIYVMRFYKYLMNDVYQKKLVDLFHKAGCEPVITRWCELLGGGSLGDVRDASYFDQVDADILGLTWYAGNVNLPFTPKNRGHLGKATADMSFLLRYNRPIALVEFNSWRSHDSAWSGGPAMTPISPLELRHHMYRGLYYGVSMYHLFSWMQPMTDFSWLNIFFTPELMKECASLRAELDRIAPYRDFGGRLPAPAAFLVSRNAQGFPIWNEKNKKKISGTDFYSTAIRRMGWLMEDPSLARLDLWEEHAGVTPDELSAYKGVIVLDACLEPETRAAIAEAARKGTRVLLICAPSFVDKHYRRAVPPKDYPFLSIEAFDDKEKTKKGDDGLKGAPEPGRAKNGYAATVSARTQMLGAGKNIEESTFKGDWAAQGYFVPAPGAKVLKKDNNRPVMLEKGMITAVAGIPKDDSTWIELLRRFYEEIGASAEPIYLSPFKKALIAQNFRSDCVRTDIDGKIDKEFPWRGDLPVPWSSKEYPAVNEARSGLPWLAYRDEKGNRTLLGVRLDSGDIKVFAAKKLFRPNVKPPPHINSVKGPVAFDRFALGWNRLRAWTMADDDGEVELSLASESWEDAPVALEVIDEKANKVIQKIEDSKSSVETASKNANDFTARFNVKKGKCYLLDFVRGKKKK